MKFTTTRTPKFTDISHLTVSLKHEAETEFIYLTHKALLVV